MNAKDLFAGDKDPNRRAELAMHILGLDHGEGYGAEYFTGINRTILTKAFEECPDCKSFAQLESVVNKLPLSDKERSDGSACFAKLHSAKLEEENGESDG